MIVGFSAHGTGDGAGPVEYLTDPDRDGRETRPPEVLRGDPELIRRLIDTVPFKHRYTSGVLSFAPGEVLTESQQHTIMDRFEAVAFAGLRREQYATLWVRHMHAGRLELHFVTPRIELTTLKALNIRPPGPQAEARYDLFRSWVNALYGLADPDDPARARIGKLPSYIEKQRAKAKRQGRDTPPDPRAIITDWLVQRIRAGLLRNRDEVVESLKAQGFDLPRIGADYLTVLDPASGERWRLKGAIYEDRFRSVDTLGDAIAPGAGAVRGPDPERADQLARELKALVDRVESYNRERYGRVGRRAARKPETPPRPQPTPSGRDAPAIPPSRMDDVGRAGNGLNRLRKNPFP